MPQVHCKLCTKKFYAKPCHLRLGHGKYCSRHCQYESRKKGKFMPCFICGQKTWKRPKALIKSKSGKFFCSKSCQTKWRNNFFSGKRHPFWKGGETTYRTILEKSGSKKTCKFCGNNDKRVLAAHHLDCNRKNNKQKNLIWLCHNCHHLVHRYGIKIDK